MTTKLFSTTYLNGVRAYIESDDRKLKKAIAQCENPNERKLLKVRLLMEQSKLVEAISLCQSISDFPAQHKAERHFLLSGTYFSKRLYERSTAEAIQAAELYQTLPLPDKLFLTYYNLSTNYSEMRWYDVSLHYLNKASECAQSLENELLILRAKACLYSQANNSARALEYLNEIETKMKVCKGFDRAAYYLVAADVCAWAKDFPKALGFYQKIKSKRKHVARERLVCQETFLRVFLLKAKPERLGMLPRFFTQDSEFAYQWKFLLAMQDGDLQQAQKLWLYLHELRPLVYGTKFESVSELEKRNIFFQCVEKLRPSSQTLQPMSHLTGHLQKAYEVFVQSPIPLRKEELIEKIWEVPYSSDYDSRFYKLMERLKTKIAAKVVQRNRAYALQPLGH